MESIKNASELGTILEIRENSMPDINVTYSLFESVFQIDRQHIYSIRLETRSEHGTETVSACDVCRNRTEAVRLFGLLADGMVTSCTLYDILEDLL